MKKKQVVLVVALSLAMVLVGQLGFAQDKKFAVGIKAAYNMYQGDDLDLFNESFDTEYDNAIGVSASFAYFFTKAFSLELGLGYQQTDMELDVPGDSAGYGELTQIPVLLTGRYHFTPSDKVMLFAGLGIGYYYNDMSNADGEGDFFEGAPSGVDSFADDGIGYHLTAGVEYFFTENIALNVDLTYVLLDVDIGFDGAGFDQKDSTSLNAFVAGLGVKYYF